LWFLDQLEPNRDLYNIPLGLHLNGQLNAAALQRSLGGVVRRHKVLRTSFKTVAGSPAQAPEEVDGVELPVVDLSELSEHERAAEVARLWTLEAQGPFDLRQALKLRAMLFRLASTQHLLVLTLHHISADGWSTQLLLRELGSLYDAFCAGRPSPLAELPIQYADFAAWQREWLQGEVLETQLGYWKAQLKGAPALLELPTERPRPASQTHRGATETAVFPQSLLTRLKALSHEEGASLFMTLLAAFQTLLGRYSGQEDIVVGSPIAGRNRPEVEGLIGFFVNMLVLRGDLSGNPTFRELLRRVREVALGAYAHQDLPFERLVEELQPERNLSYNPLFQISFTLETAPEPARLGALRTSWDAVLSGTSKFDLSVEMTEGPEGLATAVEYCTDLFGREMIQRLLGHFRVLLEGIVADPDRRIMALPLLTEAERRQLLVEWNNTATDYPAEALRLHRLIEAQAARTPDAVALEFEGQELTYALLNGRANRLARVLRARGVGPDVLVGVFAERSFEMVLSMLAVLKAGGAYVPLDPSYPNERLGYMLEDADARLLLTQPHLASRLPADAGRVMPLDAAWAAYAGESGEDLDEVGTPEDLAYVIFTSGSTGRPKGAMNTHRGICNQLLWMQEEYRLGGDERVLQKTAFSFDLSVLEFFWPLLTGARLVIARPEGHRDSSYLVRLTRESKITTQCFVPSMLRVFLEEDGVEACGSLRRVICSGEALPHELQERFFARLPGVELHNLYGPTEAAVEATYWACRPRDERLTVPIGRPVANTQIYVLDGQLEPVPIGVPGELYIGGAHVGRGYVGRPDLTAERFVLDPFSETPGARLYRTGDLVRHLSDGAIEYLGRLDYQVKIRGQRIELGEIEATLDKHPGVAQSAAVAHGVAEGRRLVAYVVPRQAVLSSGELKQHLSHALPPYMVPSTFVFLQALPLTASGKVDRKQLPVPDLSDVAPRIDAVAPRTPTEEAVIGMFRSVLERANFGVLDNFFDLGGHSLMAARLMSGLRTALGVDLPLRNLFERPTVAGLAEAIDGLQWLEKSKAPARSAGKREEIDL
jgi:amino acid adenylation domain-containing protein